MSAALPVRLRNRLAGTILDALHDSRARRELTGLAAPGGVAAWLGPGEQQWAEAVGERARRAATALDARPLDASAASLAVTLDAAAVLFDARLYFEVHELLEPHWASATGAERDALQGLVQVAVGYEHLAGGNVPGARVLLGEGSERLARGRLAGVDLATFATAVREGTAGGLAGALERVPRFPRRHRACGGP